MLVARLNQAWLDHHRGHGTSNWDITQARLLSITLVAGLEWRGGDVARSRLYTEEYCLFLSGPCIHRSSRVRGFLISLVRGLSIPLSQARGFWISQVRGFLVPQVQLYQD